MTRARLLAGAALAIFALGAAGPAVRHADAQPNTGGDTATAKCPEFGGGKPGDRKTLKTTSVVKGKKVTSSYDVICGADGKWHQVA